MIAQRQRGFGIGLTLRALQLVLERHEAEKPR
jgi:hypothetical protein